MDDKTLHELLFELDATDVYLEKLDLPKVKQLDWDVLTDAEKFRLLRSLNQLINNKRFKAESEIQDLMGEIEEWEGVVMKCDRYLSQLSPEAQRYGIKVGIIPAPGQLPLFQESA